MAGLRLLLPLLSLLLGILPRAARAEVTLIPPDGPLVPGVESRVWVVVHQDGRLLPEVRPTLDASPGEVVRGEGLVRPGVQAFRYRAPPEARGPVTFTVGVGGSEVERVTLPLADPLRPTLRGVPRVEASAGTERRVLVPFTSADPVDPSFLLPFTSEGRIGGVRPTRNGVELVLEPGEERFPRVVLVGLLDLGRPTAPPAWATVHLVGRSLIPIRTEPGARATLSVGGRTWGPFVADATGVATATLPVRPGDTTATVQIEDDLGNVQTTTLTLQRDPRPVLVVVPAPALLRGGQAAPVHVAVVDSAGVPWSGAPPTCETVPGGRPGLVSEGPGSWRLQPSLPQAERFLDLRVSCELPAGLGAAQVRLPVDEGVPRALQLRLYPEELTADFPVAQVQVVLEDRLGERLDLTGVQVGAEIGEVRVVSSEARTLRAEYDGTRAAGEGTDRIWARLELEPGTGPAASLLLAHGPPGPAGLPVYGRVLDRRGSPLPGLPVALSVDDGAAATATSDDRGWARAVLPLPEGAPLVVLRARTAFLEARAPFLPADPDPPADPEAPDIETSQSLSLAAGRVRQVSITTEPTLLHPGPSATARVLVRLQDRQGHAVIDDSLVITADVGSVTAPRARPDGTYEAWYSPPAGQRAGEVHLSVRGREGSFGASTTLRLAPRPMRAAVGIAGGFLTNFGTVASPAADIGVETRLRVLPERIRLRLGAGVYGVTTATEDAATGSVVELRQVLLPVTLAGLARQEQGLRASWLGAGVVVAGWTGQATYGDADRVDLRGVTGPGGILFAGTGWRAGTGELDLELRYLYVPLRRGDLAYDGSVGGLAAVAGWRVLF